MVEIRDADENEASEAGASSSNETGSNQQQQSQPSTSFIAYCKQDVISTAISWLRIVCLLFTLHYLTSIFSVEVEKNSYAKAFVSAAASNAFRLHQRLRQYNGNLISREFLSQLFYEDSAHYLLYCVAFMTSAPVTMALFPIAGYATFHTVTYLITVARVLGKENAPWVQSLCQAKEKYSYTWLSTIACVEIFIFPVFCAMILTGKASIMFIFIYYRFLWLRYASRRNPHTRIVFQQLKQSLMEVITRPECPAAIRNVIFKCVSVVERLAPPV